MLLPQLHLSPLKWRLMSFVLRLLAERIHPRQTTRRVQDKLSAACQVPGPGEAS